jgi:hypothetical protein
LKAEEPKPEREEGKKQEIVTPKDQKAKQIATPPFPIGLLIILSISLAVFLRFLSSFFFFSVFFLAHWSIVTLSVLILSFDLQGACYECMYVCTVHTIQVYRKSRAVRS